MKGAKIATNSESFQFLQNAGVYDVSDNLYSPASNFFNVGNYILTFATDYNPKEHVELHVHYYENMVQFFLQPSLNSIRDLFLNTNVTDVFECHLFQDVPQQFQTSTIFFNIQLFSTDLVNHMQNVTTPKNDFELLRRVFPQFEEELFLFETLSYDDDSSLYDDLSTPDVKLFYPEPFIASPSFVHEDVWFLHILQYQHWLWFFFISLIMFFFITFINTVRWCNARTKPKRETRGVSRSKCADLITACVPVSWAMSIIISESVDASDYYDGFGTGEIVIGIRAYQWGWEYFYPKGIDLNYTVSPSYSTAVGNSLKYSTTSEQNLQSNTLWKHYQLNNNSNGSSTPAHILLSPSDNTKILNFTNFNDIGINTLDGSKAFKKIQKFSKTNTQDLFTNISDFSTRYTRIADMYYTNKNLIDASTYSTIRQHNFTSNTSTQNHSVSFLDTNSVSKFLNYTNSVDKVATEPNSNYITRLINPANTSLNTNTTDNLLTDNKTLNNPVYYNLRDNSTKTLSVVEDMALESEFSFDLSTESFTSTLNNLDTNYIFTDLKSINQSINTSDRTVRTLNDSNLSQLNSNTNTSAKEISDSVIGPQSQGLGNKVIASNASAARKWASFMQGYRLLNNQTTTPVQTAPLIGTSPYIKSLSFDKPLSESVDSPLLKSKEESAPNMVFETYWLTHWANTQSNHYFNHLNKLLDTTSVSMFPLITEYMEYDFKNWQTLEALEDVFWETSFSSFAQDEYLTVKDALTKANYFDTQDDVFNSLTRTTKFKFNKIKSTTDLSQNTMYNSLTPDTEEVFPNSSLTKLRDYRLFTLEPVADSFDDSYENLKQLNLLYKNNYNHLVSLDTNRLNPTSYTQVLDAFRADSDGSSWTSNDIVQSDLTNLNDIETINALDDRVSNPLKLRSTAKNSMVTYSAMQKVFKSRLDEGRSNARLQDISNSYNPYLFWNASRTNYEGLLSKNTDNFFKINNYVDKLKPTFSTMYEVNNILNSYFTDLPFLVSQISDSSRHLWFDWQSRWTSLEVQPSSTARYSLLGVPYTNRSFEYATQQGDELNDSENYLVRLARARKNYATSWAYTPYLYSRLSTWQSSPDMNVFNFNQNSLVHLKLNLSNLKEMFLINNILNSSLQTTPSFSNYSTPGRSFIQPIAGTSAYNFNTNTLVSLLTKREYMYRQYLKTKGLTLSLPVDLVSSPTNPLYIEIKNSSPLLDPSTFSSEISREYLYSTANFIQMSTISKLLGDNLPNTPLFYFFGLTKPQSLGSNAELFKNQYRPMRKGITNMVRLHATGAIALPTEIRLHILASSKDVIHSWAIPSAGIKIDCVPGFSSHRVAIFLSSGIFWGQCMEICGRFHHWMPIILYFMKRDLFFLWCTHFQQYNTNESRLSAGANLNTNLLKPVNYSNWNALSI